MPKPVRNFVRNFRAGIKVEQDDKGPPAIVVTLTPQDTLSRRPISFAIRGAERLHAALEEALKVATAAEAMRG